MDMKILEAIGVTQECLQSGNTKKMRSLIPKMDLAKAYNKVEWGIYS